MRALLLSTALLSLASFSSQSYGELQQYSFQNKALAANAGGQDAYAIRWADDEIEWSLFLNQYLRAGNQPVVGGLYSFRFPACDLSCWVPTYMQVGFGGSTAGPLAELLVGTALLRTVRIDMGTHFIATQTRIVVWSYPLWFGFSLVF